MTDAHLHARAGALFLKMRELPPNARLEALRKATGDDLALRDEVLSLLEHDLDDESKDLQPSDQEAKRIGPYVLRERIGGGGSGQVYLADQDAPVRRRVAIKFVPQASMSDELGARFDMEVRALERMEHPGIVRVLDKGRSSEGTPYLVMDFIDGVPMTSFCRTQKLTLIERLQLILDVCDAVHHAHQRGVIHRDLKPANILVRMIDQRPVACVLDFGIAKSIAGMHPEDSPPTLGLPLGTPAYMAPEQTGVGEVDTRTDVYAIGAVIYELTTGRPPHHRRR